MIKNDFLLNKFFEKKVVQKMKIGRCDFFLSKKNLPKKDNFFFIK